MKGNIAMPVYALETETGDIYCFNKINELKIMVEEFFDILKEEFIFWDRNGYRISFDKSFIQDNINEAIIEENEEEVMNKIIACYMNNNKFENDIL